MILTNMLHKYKLPKVVNLINGLFVLFILLFSLFIYLLIKSRIKIQSPVTIKVKDLTYISEPQKYKITLNDKFVPTKEIQGFEYFLNYDPENAIEANNNIKIRSYLDESIKDVFEWYAFKRETTYPGTEDKIIINSLSDFKVKENDAIYFEVLDENKESSILFTAISRPDDTGVLIFDCSLKCDQNKEVFLQMLKSIELI